MSEPEPSYYEIALTNRQVLVGFVLLLVCVLAAFVSGVWVCRSSTPAVAVVPMEPTVEEEPSPLAEIPRIGFFDEGESSGAAQPPDISELQRSRNEPGSTLAEDVGAEPPVTSPPPPATSSPAQPPPASPAPPQTTSPPPPAQTSPPPPETTSPPPPQASPSPSTSAVDEPTEGFIIQVLSSRDASQARQVVERLRGGGYPAYVSPLERGNLTMYRVRIGPYSERSSAERAASEVNTTFKLDTWVTAAGN